MLIEDEGYNLDEETMVETDVWEVSDAEESTQEREVRMSELHELAKAFKKDASEAKSKVFKAMSQVIKAAGQKEQNYKIIIYQNQEILKSTSVILTI